METLYIVLIFILFILAVSDLIVGVSNDAVNFLVSAIGSKAAPFWTIMVIASGGILVGAIFSSGMMEVARKGIFHPELFFFSEIMMIYLAVMLTDIILLDLFNTFGMPTSTTVSIVFELLGAAVAISVIKTYSDDSTTLSEFINSAKALAIISGILLSVVVAFTVGAMVQYVARIIFSFKTEKTIKNFGALWGGLAITAIVYFILIKGLKSTPYAEYVMPNGEVLKDWVKHNVVLISSINFVFWTIILQFLNWIFKTNILKVVVLTGTFALAMAFAGNDLVNFIGVPLAGYSAFKLWIAESAANGVSATEFLMQGFQGKVGTPTLFLIIAGAIMVLTLWLSKKARSVTKTSLDLSRQDEGNERFGSTAFSRVVVRASIGLSQAFNYITPKPLAKKIESRFVYSQTESDKAANVEFDLIRASVNLVVASILISFATSLKLPLSTTYVTFMVAMGTSLADGAWGRESAVYRITGVISVIGGWFFTALIAFSVAFIFAMLISINIYFVFVILAIALFIIYKTKIVHSKRATEESSDAVTDSNISDENVFDKSSEKIRHILKEVVLLYNKTIDNLIAENYKGLKRNMAEMSKINKQTKKLKDNANKTIIKFENNAIEKGHFYVQALDYLREISHAMSFIITPIYQHVGNNHKGLIDEQIEDLNALKEAVNEFSEKVAGSIKKETFEEIDNIIAMQSELLNLIKSLRKRQIKRIKAKTVGTRNSMLYLNLVSETKNLILFTHNLFKSQRDFLQNGQC